MTEKILLRTLEAGSLDKPIWARVREAVHSGKVLVVTGAGVSAESDIPTFRSVDGTGLYESAEWNPLEFLRSTTLENHSDKLWDYYLNRFSSGLRGKTPNPAHVAIKHLEEAMGNTEGEFLLVTQNIDGLHRAAGSSCEKCIEIHGNKKMRCSYECWFKNNEEPQLQDIPENAKFPEDLMCSKCGNLMRPHVLLFDEYYSQELYRSDEAHDFAASADVIITIGCSAVVPIAYFLARTVVENEGLLVDVNPAEEGPLVELAEQEGIRVQARAGEALPGIVDFLTS